MLLELVPVTDPLIVVPLTPVVTMPNIGNRCEGNIVFLKFSNFGTEYKILTCGCG